MLKNPKVWVIVIAAIVMGALVKIFTPLSIEAVRASISFAPEQLFAPHIGGYVFSISNTMCTTWIAMLIIVILFFFGTRKMQLIPGGLQNVLEMLIEYLVGLAESVAGHRAMKFFAIASTIFILLLVSNLIALIPGFGPIGVIHLAEGEHAPQGITIIGDAPSIFETKHEPGQEGPILAPFVRAPATDLNLALALALISVVMTQVYGFQAQGARYLTRFFSFGRLLKGNIAFGLIDVFVGIVELISEIMKIVAFTFRLFGNIFAGEIVLLIMAYLFLVLPFPFYGLELFVAVIQAFVFAVLTLAFMTIASAEHEAGAEHH
ncbi:MAG: ATP synthase F0 subunit A [Chloroflexota bacterium]|nr:MAG: ATP synthase F0 subunit A [Chloroflexota bacterium]